jgi:hypothetical protein
LLYVFESDALIGSRDRRAARAPNRPETTLMTTAVRLLLLATFVFGSTAAFSQADKDKGQAPKVEIPHFGNAACPYMDGKKAKIGQYFETSKGRVHVCCKDCVAEAKDDGEAAYAKAYPKTTTLENKTCPISGHEIGEGAVATTWQGYAFKLCCDGCVKGFKKNPDAALALLTNAKLKDVGNKVCPVSGEAADGGCAIVGDELVRLRGRKDADELKKDPAAYLKKAKEEKKEKPKDGDDRDKGRGNDKENDAKKDGDKKKSDADAPKKGGGKGGS